MQVKINACEILTVKGSRDLQSGGVGAGHARENRWHEKRQLFFIDFKVGCAAARCFEDTVIIGDAKMIAWVLMPDHAHWLSQLGKKYTFDQVMNRMKSPSARLANRALGRQHITIMQYDHFAGMAISRAWPAPTIRIQTDFSFAVN